VGYYHCNLFVLPTSLQYKGRPLVTYHKKSIIAAIALAALGHLMMFCIFLFNLVMLMCRNLKVKTYYIGVRTGRGGAIAPPLLPTGMHVGFTRQQNVRATSSNESIIVAN